MHLTGGLVLSFPFHIRDPPLRDNDSSVIVRTTHCCASTAADLRRTTTTTRTSRQSGTFAPLLTPNMTVLDSCSPVPTQTPIYRLA